MPRPHSSRTLDLPCLDPPGTSRTLVIPFAFSRERPSYQQMFDNVHSTDPFTTLPRVLIPSLRYTYVPPRMLYGWPAPKESLLAYAKKKKIVVRSGRTIDEPATLGIALRIMMLESGVANLPHDMLRPRITPVGADDQQRVVVAVYSNYDFTRKELPSQETMEKLGQCLGVEGPPRWYLDGLNWYWRLW